MDTLTIIEVMSVAADPTNAQIAVTHDQIILGLIALVGTSIAALVFTIKNNTLGKAIAQDASAANKAVNNIGPGEHRLYDVIARIENKQQEFDKLWGNLPSELSNAVSLSETIHMLNEKLHQIDMKLDAHIIREDEFLDRLKFLEEPEEEEEM